MKLSVLLPTLNRPEHVRNLLHSLLRQTRLPEEVIVVDQSPHTETAREVVRARKAAANRPMRFEYARQQEKSIVKARNRGVALANGEILCFVDDDIVLYDDYFEKIERAFEGDPSIGGVMGNVVLSAKLSGLKWKIRRAFLKFFLLNDFKGRMTPSGFGYPFFDIDDREITERVPVELFSGYSMNFRREFLQDEPCDEWFTGYSFREDVDLSYRISRKTNLWLIPDARFWHRNAPANRLDVEALTKMQVRNYYYVFRKHKHKNFFSTLLFFYSLGGLVLMDFLEWLAQRNHEKFLKLKAGVGAALALAREPYAKNKNFAHY